MHLRFFLTIFTGKECVKYFDAVRKLFKCIKSFFSILNDLLIYTDLAPKDISSDFAVKFPALK